MWRICNNYVIHLNRVPFCTLTAIILKNKCLGVLHEIFSVWAHVNIHICFFPFGSFLHDTPHECPWARFQWHHNSDVWREGTCSSASRKWIQVRIQTLVTMSIFAQYIQNLMKISTCPAYSFPSKTKTQHNVVLHCVWRFSAPNSISSQIEI
jgi:hypothetical protein